MKKLILILATLLLSVVANANEGEEKFTKEGFFTTKWCAERGYFSDCRLETYFCGDGECFQKWETGEPETEELVLFVHDEGKYYNVKLAGNLPRYELDEATNRNKVTVMGSYNEATNTITADEYKAPPPPSKSFFKGCL